MNEMKDIIKLVAKDLPGGEELLFSFLFVMCLVAISAILEFFLHILINRID